MELAKKRHADERIIFKWILSINFLWLLTGFGVSGSAVG
jgi:hypothetical protein